MSFCSELLPCLFLLCELSEEVSDSELVQGDGNSIMSSTLEETLPVVALSTFGNQLWVAADGKLHDGEVKELWVVSLGHHVCMTCCQFRGCPLCCSTIGKPLKSKLRKRPVFARCEGTWLLRPKTSLLTDEEDQMLCVVNCG